MQSLKTQNVIKIKSRNDSKALEHVRDIITKYASQEPVSFFTEKAKEKNFFKAVAGFAWA